MATNMGGVWQKLTRHQNKVRYICRNTASYGVVNIYDLHDLFERFCSLLIVEYYTTYPVTIAEIVTEIYGNEHGWGMVKINASPK